jgi:hypothetical protein
MSKKLSRIDILKGFKEKQAEKIFKKKKVKKSKTSK